MSCFNWVRLFLWCATTSSISKASFSFRTSPSISLSLDTCSRILKLLPPACQKICQDVGKTNCTWYLKLDYNLRCFDETHNKYVIGAYVGSSYSLLLPLCTLFVLYWYHHRLVLKAQKENTPVERHEIVEGMRLV